MPEAVEQLGGPIDVLVNNAAAAMYAQPSEMPLKRRRITFEVNVHAPLDLAQAALPAMLETGEGWIVNVSSATGKLDPGPPFKMEGLAATTGMYGSSKAALNRETNALAHELWGRGIRVNTVEPRAAVMSEGAEVLAGHVIREDMIESMEEMVEAAVYLCDCDVETTGQVFVSLDLIADRGVTVMTLDGGDAVEQSFECRVAFAHMTATTDRVIDLLDGDLYAGDPYPTYAWMRDHAPVYWDAENELWGIARYDHIVEIEKAKDVFINSDRVKGGYRPNLPSDPSIIGLDDPMHTKRRKLVNRGFTPRTVLGVGGPHPADRHRAARRRGAPRTASSSSATSPGPLPAQMIGLLLGYPHEMWPKLMEWSARTIVGGGGPRYADDDVIIAAIEFAGACAELYEEKQRCPADDIMTVWTTAEIDGEPIGLDPVISDCLLLLDGGAETTRTVIARTILELAARPDQYQLLRDGADMTVAVEEFIRWVTPVLNMCRVANRDYEIGGQTIRAGQQVVLMYQSANRDPEHFDDPERYDVTRTPNHHIAFGFGTHFCLGAALARLEIKMFFEEFVRRVREINVVPGSVDFLPNAFVNGVNRAEVELVYG